MSGYAITSIKLITATPSGGLSSGGARTSPLYDLSTHGEKVAFDWYGQPLAVGNDFFDYNVYVRDTVLNSTSLVASTALNAGISGDGTAISFSSYANFVPSDDNGVSDAYLRDLQTGTTTLLSHVPGSGAPGNRDSGYYGNSVSADGNRVAFFSHASNLTTDSGVGGGNVFLADTLTGTVTLVSRADGVNGAPSNYAFYPDMAAAGQHVSFYSVGLTPDSGNYNIYLRDLGANTTRLASRADGVNGAAVGSASGFSSVSADGRYVAFDTATGFTSGDNNNTYDVFLRDMLAGTTTLISRASGAAGDVGNSYSYTAGVSDDGRYVAFESDASNLVAGDFNGVRDIFVRDTWTNTTTRVSLGLDGSPTINTSFSARISGDGHHVAFWSYDTQTLAGLAPVGNAQLFMVTLSGAPEAPSITRLVDDAPLLTGDITAGGLTNDATPGVVISLANATAGDTLTLLLDGNTLSSTTLTTADIAAGSITLATGIPTDGAHIFTATLGNSGGTSDPSAGFVFTLDTTAPTLANVVASAQSALTIGQTTTITLSFSEAVSGLEAADIATTGGTLGALTSLDGITWTGSFTPADNFTGSATISLAGAFTDLAGNTGTASPILALAVDTLAPTLLVFDIDDTTLTYGETATLTLIFNEAVQGLTADDIAVSGGTLGALTTLDRITWTGSFTPTANATGNATAQLTGSNADLAGNAGAGSAPLSIAYDTRTLAAQPPVNPLIYTGDVPIGLNFNIPVVGLDAGDFAATAGGFAGLSGGPQDFTLTYRPHAAFEGVVTISLNGAGYRGQNGAPGASTSFNLTVDTLSPTVAVTTSETLLNGTETALITYTFSEAVTGLELSDLTSVGGTLSNLVGGGTIFSALFTPTQGYERPGNAAIKPNSYTDLAGNSGAAGSIIFLVDSIAPEFAFTALDADTGRSPTDLITNDTTLILQGTLSEEGMLKLEQRLLPDGPWELIATQGYEAGAISYGPTAPLTDGTRIFRATPIDIAGNIGLPVTLVVTTDTAPPAAPLLLAITEDTNTPADRVTLDHSLAFSGTAEANSRVELFLGGRKLGEALADANGAFRIDATGTTLPDGILQFTATATDVAGNTSLPSANFQVITFPGNITLNAGPAWNQSFTGGYGDDRITGSGGNNTAQGAYGDDTITLGGYNNTLDGGEGNDTLIAGEGNATVDGGAGDDQITAGGYNNAIRGGAGNDRIDAGQGNAQVDAGTGDNVITLRGYNNIVTAGAGRDVVFGGDGNSTFNLGDGDNEIHARGFNNIVTLGNGNNIVEDFDGHARITAGDGNNIITLHGFNNIVTLGGGANLLLLLGGGNNTVTTTGGGNILRAEGNGNLITLGGDAGSNAAVFSGPLAGYSFAHLDSPTRGHGLAVTATGPGWTLDLFNVEKLQFANGVNLANYSGASQGLTARLDYPAMNTGNAQGDGSTGISGLIGSNFGDFLVGDGGANLLLGLGGDDYLAGVGGNDTMLGGDGNDQFWGGEGGDVLDGGAGYDIARYDFAASGVVARLDGGLNGGEAAGDTFTAIEALYGSAFGDVLIGSAAGDVLVGLDGGDLLYGLGGNDLLFGGSGIDAFAFNTIDFGTDLVMDFNTTAAAGANHDYVDFRGIPGLSAFALSQVGADTHVVTNHGTVILQNIIASTLVGGDFLF